MLRLLQRLKGGCLSDKVGRSAGEQLRFKLQRDLREMAKIEQQYPDLLAPGLFFAWQRHRQLKKVCKGYAAELSWLIGSTAEAILVDALGEMVAAGQLDSSAAALYRRWFPAEDADTGDSPVL